MQLSCQKEEGGVTIFIQRCFRMYSGVIECFDLWRSSVKIYDGNEGHIYDTEKIPFDAILAANYLLDKFGRYARMPSTVFFCDDIFSADGCTAGFSVFMKLDNNGDIAFVSTNKIAANRAIGGCEKVLFDESQINRAMNGVIVDRSDQKDVVERFASREGAA